MQPQAKVNFSKKFRHNSEWLKKELPPVALEVASNKAPPPRLSSP
ncbi:hypothetical protein [Desulfogranum mediterraneum]|nr:hypothetical protein [Desulfogranum mediterraneum]